MSIQYEKVFRWLERVEGALTCRGYIPCRRLSGGTANYRGDRPVTDYEAMGASGVTVGVGVDLGQQTASQLRSWGVSDGTLDAILIYIGLQRGAALRALRNRPLTLTVEQARVASVLFSRVMNACRSLSGRQDFLPARFLKGGLRVLMDPAPDPCVLKEDAERLDNALSYSHRCLTPGPRSASPVWQSFSALPLAHAKAVLETPLPDGDFRPVPGDSLPPRGSGRAAVRAWLDAVTEKGVKPGLFRCEARAADASVRLLLNAGGTSGSGWNAVSMQRLWMTGPELTLLAGHADVDVFEARVCPAGRRPGRILSFLASLPPWAGLSLTMSVILDALWHSSASKHPGRVREPGRVSKPAGAPFLYAADQALLFPAAVKADSLGFEVQGWSSGMVRINTAGAGFPELEELCAKACLLPPVMRFDPAAFPPPSFSAGSPGDFLRAVEEDPSRGPEALRRLLFSGDLAAVLKLDRLILEALLEKRESGHAV